MDSLIGQTLGQYQIVAPIGSGGMATIYQAYQPSLNRYVALKILPPDYPPDSRLARHFTREAQVAALLDHPNILPVYDLGRQGDIGYIAMKYVPGGSLGDRLGRPMPLTESLRLIEHIASALDEAHARGIVHCDVTPRNILIDERGWPYLADFGLSHIIDVIPTAVAVPAGATPESSHPAAAKSQPDLLAMGGVVFEMLTRPRYEGTPAYMSPEQGRGLPVDARTDVYALGAILFEMLTGQLLYDAETAMGIVLKQITASTPQPRQFNPDIPAAVEQIILKALDKNPDQRFASAGEFAAALRQALQGVEPGVVALSAPPTPKPLFPAEIGAPPGRSALPRSSAFVSSQARSGPNMTTLIWGGVVMGGGFCLLFMLVFYFIFGQFQ